MLNKDSFYTGVLIAIIFPAIALAAEHVLNNNAFMITRPALFGFAAIGLNLILLRIAYKKGAGKTVRGIMLATFVFMLLLFILKTHPVK